MAPRSHPAPARPAAKVRQLLAFDQHPARELARKEPAVMASVVRLWLRETCG